MMNSIAVGQARCSLERGVSGVFLVLAFLFLVSSSGWTAEPETWAWGETYFDDMSAPEGAEKLASILADELLRPSLSDLAATYTTSNWSSSALVAEIALDVTRGVGTSDAAGGEAVRLGKLRAYGRVPCPMTSGPPTYEAVMEGADDESIARKIRSHAGRFEWHEARSLGRLNLADRHVHCELVIEWAKVEFERGFDSKQKIDWVWFELAFRSLVELRRWGSDLDGQFDTEVDLLFWMSDAFLNADSPELSLALAVVADDLRGEYELGVDDGVVQPSTPRAAIKQRIEALEPMVHDGH